MAPTMVEMAPIQRHTVIIDAKPSFPATTPTATERLSLELKDKTEIAAEAAPVVKAEEQKEESTLQLVIKNETPAAPPTPAAPATPVASVKIGEHMLTADELEEKRRFEEQKQALEERAERLRRMSFNIKNTESTDDLENVPAYVRKNVNLDNSVASADKFLSGYSVGMNDQQNNTQASIQTINTFLDGKKPD
jgi:cell division protein FtsZ